MQRKLDSILEMDLDAIRKQHEANVTLMTQTSMTEREIRDQAFISELLDMETDTRQHNFLMRLQEIERSQDLCLKDRVKMSRAIKQKLISTLL